MRTLIEAYENIPGDHCGSVAMGNLLNHYAGLRLPEAAVFGLGSGVTNLYLRDEQMDPAYVLFGRTATMEADLATSLDVHYVEQVEADDQQAWQLVRDEVLAGRPTMLSGDIFYLDYREYKVHFPAHRFVLVGFDDDSETAYIADRINSYPEACSYAALFASRNPPEGLSTFNLWGRFEHGKPGNSLGEACRIAIERNARRMLESESGGEALMGAEYSSAGLVALDDFAADLPGWQARDDAAWICGYTAQCIEKFGNGGGNFRRLYAGFLEWAGRQDPDLAGSDEVGLATESADAWTRLSQCLAACAENPGEDAGWRQAQRELASIREAETRLFEELALRSAR